MWTTEGNNCVSFYDVRAPPALHTAFALVVGEAGGRRDPEVQGTGVYGMNISVSVSPNPSIDALGTCHLYDIHDSPTDEYISPHLIPSIVHPLGAFEVKVKELNGWENAGQRHCPLAMGGGGAGSSEAATLSTRSLLLVLGG